MTTYTVYGCTRCDRLFETAGERKISDRCPKCATLCAPMCYTSAAGMAAQANTAKDQPARDPGSKQALADFRAGFPLIFG